MSKNVGWGEVTNPNASAYIRPTHTHSRDQQQVRIAKAVVLGFLSSPQPTLGGRL